MKKAQIEKLTYSKKDQQILDILKKVHNQDKKQHEQPPSFYAVLPSFIRYSQKLKPFDKLLYCEISALSNLYGFCYASNSYLASLYNVSVDTIKRSLANLKDNGFIYIKRYQDTESNFLYRCIFLGSIDLDTIKKNVPNFTNQDMTERFPSLEAEELSRLFCMAVYGKETPPTYKK